MLHGPTTGWLWASVSLVLLLRNSAAAAQLRSQARTGRSSWLGATAVLGPPVLSESCQGDPRAAYTVAVVLAGRQSTMHVLVEYLDILVAQCQLHEVHIWDYCRNENDRDWLLHDVARHPGFEILIPSSSGSNTSRKWEEMYQYYASPAANESSARARFRPRLDGVAVESTVIVKMDDDIVFIDTGRFPAFLRYIRGHPRTFIVHANIVNNGVAAYYQAEHFKLLRSAFPELRKYPVSRRGVVGMDGPLLSGPEVATELHRMFLLAPEKFSWEGPDGDSCVAFQSPERKLDAAGQGRFSINFFGARWQSWHSMPALVKAQGDDEQAITLGATLKGFTECMFTPFNVVHHKFRTQGPIPRYIIEAYEDLLAKWKGDAADESSPENVAITRSTAAPPSAAAAAAVTEGSIGAAGLHVGAAGAAAASASSTAAPSAAIATGAKAEQPPALRETSKPARAAAYTLTVSTSPPAVPGSIDGGGSTPLQGDPSVLPQVLESWFGRDGPLAGLLDGAAGAHAGSAGSGRASPASEPPAADFLTAAQAISKWLAS